MRTMYCNVLLRNGTVYLPTMGKMGEGFYRGVEPVAVVAAQNAAALREALITTIRRGNPNVSTLKRRDWLPPVVLKYTGVKSWKVFEQNLRLWDIEEKDGIIRIVGNFKKNDGTWAEDSGQTLSFQPNTVLDEVVDCMVTILREATPK
jgi:hypothetical protein